MTEEMKNKISMELQNPVTQQGFEIICKHLEEKDKEIKDLEWQLKEVIEDNDSYQKDNTEKDKQIKRLNNFIDEQRTTIARQIVELTEKDRQIEELKNDMATAIPLLEKAECTSCIYTDSPCVRGDYPMKDGHCTHHKHFGDEIAVLKKQNEQLTLKLDAIKWHKVADGDLPRETEFIESDVLLLLVQLKGTKHKRYELGRYNFSGNVFSYTHLKLIENVVAWCEIPTFTDKEINE